MRVGKTSFTVVIFYRSAFTQLTDHDTGGNSIPFQPERDEGGGNQNYTRNEDGGEIKGAIPGEHQVNFQATVISYSTGGGGMAPVTGLSHQSGRF